MGVKLGCNIFPFLQSYSKEGLIWLSFHRCVKNPVFLLLDVC